ncbi:MAG TPA: hypothetical protein PKK26_08825 [Candidatus Wallbacteria bacterium]|nr:hypothetical protein [Candidatus Wallbacteria bacterium]
MKFTFEMPPENIHLLAHILESYENVGIITTEMTPEKRAAAGEPVKKPDGPRSIIVANIADDYVDLFKDILKSLDGMDLKIKPLEEDK